MTETLAQKRCRFSRDICQLILHAESLGYGAAFDQVKRTQAEANANAASGKGIVNSLHLIGLAADILLYKGDRYITNDEGHKELGAFWKSLGPDHKWGGDFKARDYNHYSITHGGIK